MFSRRVASSLFVRARVQSRFLSTAAINVNGTQYNVPQKGSPPIVGICLDGTSMDYIDAAREAGVMPNYDAIMKNGGQQALVATVVPTFTNPNNVAIVTGTTPDKNGISGNFFWNEETGEEIMMNDPKYLRCPTILGRMSQEGVKVRVVTSKDKLLKLLTDGFTSESFGFSAEKALEENTVERLKEQGISDVVALMGSQPPTIYDPAISIYTVEAGVKMIERDMELGVEGDAPRMYYLSTTDFVQHKNAPGTPDANHFYAEMDRILGRLHELGAIVGITADHGMNDKVNFDGTPFVVYLESLLNEHGIGNRTILPITDPYVVHHGALGSYATIYLNNKDDLKKSMQILRETKGVYNVFDNNEASRSFELPSDRIGDLVVLGTQESVLGR